MANRDWFTNAFGATVEDIRHKFVEEGWFGRTVTPRSPRHPTAQPSEQRTLAEQFGWGNSHDRETTHAPAQDHSHDLDR